jgi:hypothetical protein
MGGGGMKRSDNDRRPRKSSTTPREHLFAFGLFLVGALLLFAPKVASDPDGRILAKAASDPEIFLWALRWWPHALSHGLDPLYTDVVYAPSGINLAWTTAIPAPGVLASPLTTWLGPVSTFNILTLLAPPTAAYGAYVLARQITERHLPSLAAGFLFGFSAYMWREQWGGHLNLTLVALVPLCAALVIARIKGRVRPAPFVVLLAVGLAAEFYVSIEVFATMTIVGTVVYALIVAVAPRQSRRTMLATGGLVALAYLLAAALVSPFLWAMVAHPRPLKHFPPVPFRLEANTRPWTVFAGLVVPGPLVAGGSLIRPDLIGRDGLYLTLPSVALLGHLAWSKRRSPWLWAGAIGFLLVLLCAMGPAVEVAGRTVPLPWLALRDLPLLGLAVPRRLFLFAVLIAAVGAAVWLAAASSWRRWMLVGLASLMILPNLFADHWARDVSLPPFIAQGLYRQHLAPGEIVLIADRDKATPMLWLAESDFFFRAAAGFLGEAPPEFGNPKMPRLVRPPLTRAKTRSLRRYVRLHQVTAILIAPGEAPDLAGELQAVLGGTVARAGGVDILSLPALPRARPA